MTENKAVETVDGITENLAAFFLDFAGFIAKVINYIKAYFTGDWVEDLPEVVSTEALTD